MRKINPYCLDTGNAKNRLIGINKKFHTLPAPFAGRFQPLQVRDPNPYCFVAACHVVTLLLDTCAVNGGEGE